MTNSAVLRSSDGTRIVAEAHGEGPLTFVMAHGITGNRRKAGITLITQWLAPYGRVVVFDQRGHGESAGACTLSYREPLDLDAVCAWARTLSDAPLVTVGFSMGAAVAIRHAALTTAPDRMTPKDREIQVRERPDATVLVSGVGEWFFRGTHVMDRMFRITATPWGRLALRVGEGVKLTVRDWGEGPDTPACGLPTSPAASAAVITHPLLFVHGDRDHYFPPEHSARVHRAAVEAGNTSAELWVEPGMGHAERGTTQELTNRIAAWSATVLRA